MHATATPAERVTIRAAEPSDRMALAKLAQLEGAAPVFDAVLVAEQDGTPIAAITADGATLADPFRHTAGIVDFMRSETAARLFGTVVPLGESRALSARYEPRRSRRYWRAKAATNAGL
jgi:hypothetical protein